MNRSMIFAAISLVAASLGAGCASTPESDQVASNILQGNSVQPACGRGEVQYCRATSAGHFPGSAATERCGCVPKSVFNAPLVTSGATKVR